jgi:TonB-dependent SusC/RagA subfamily outer membrane receptor
MKQFSLFIALFISLNGQAQNAVTTAPQPLESSASVKIMSKSGKEIQPLLILDGVVLHTPTEEAFQKQIKAIDPNSIEKIDVLKGEAATKSLYGEKGANGVILITTKKK